MKRKLGINVDCLMGVSPLEAIEMIHRAGFETFFTGNQDRATVAALKQKADELGLCFEFIHAPFNGINNIWLSGMEYLTIHNAMKHSIDLAAENGIPTVITHVSSGWNAPAVNDLGLSRYDELVLYAKEKGVILAFENLRMTGNLAVLIDRYEKLDNVRYCFDCGHEHCYTKTVSWMDLFTTRAICTHIHDNHGRPFEDKVNDFDTHLLPFDGTYNYEKMMRKLDEYGYEGSLMLEVSNRKSPYCDLSHEDFLQTCYERIKKISEM